MTNDAYTLTVSKFNNYIKDIFNAEELLHNIKIVGEVFGVSKTKTSVYFSIKDEDSSLPCICFYADVAQNLNEGEMVVVTGSPNFYAKSGRFNFVVTKVEPFGLGLLYQRFLELKEKLEKEGLFDQSHKKPVPKNIKRIGVVTSKDGAVLQDIKNVTWRRNRAVDIVLYSTKVQGIGAEKEIAQGIDFFSNYSNVDVVVVARGGGSMEDLSAFNTEIVARATYDCKKPVVSAVGHETDFTIIDFVSDLRAPTPSAAAELLTKDTQTLQSTLNREISRISRLIDNYIAEKTLLFHGTKNIVLATAESLVGERQKNLAKKRNYLTTKIQGFVLEQDYKLNLTITTLKKLNPLDILAQGYAKIEQDGKVVNTLSKVDFDKTVEINFVDGLLKANPENKE